MNQKEINDLAAVRQREAEQVLKQSGIVEVWKNAGCRVNTVGSLRMGLMVNHRDIDLHVYSKNITEEKTFAIAARMAQIPEVMEVTSINGLHTEEHCMEWHVKYRNGDEVWKFDIIHIEEGTEYDGYFEKMADRIIEVSTQEQKETILRLKYETPEDESIIGVEYYEAVITAGVSSLPALREWLKEHRKKQPYYWMP